MELCGFGKQLRSIGFVIKDAAGDPAKAISIGKQFGADIVIYARVSQRPGTVTPMMPYAEWAGLGEGQGGGKGTVLSRTLRMGQSDKLDIAAAPKACRLIDSKGAGTIASRTRRPQDHHRR